MVASNEADRQWAETHHQSRDHIIISDDENLILILTFRTSKIDFLVFTFDVLYFAFNVMKHFETIMN